MTEDGLTTIFLLIYMRNLIFLFFVLFITCRSVAQENVPVAFPGAEGFGKYTTGGRGGRVYIVNNLNDKGEGSFREAAQAKEKRTILFSVAGTIHLESPLLINGQVTIAGQSAPGDGICIADQPVKISGNQVIVRYLRFRMGDQYQSQKGMVDGSGSDDALSANKCNNLIIDHCSFSWSTDEVLSVYGGDSTTLQWNIIAEPLNYSYHFEAGDKDWEKHGFGGIWGGSHLTAHHNIFAHCVNRNPRFNGARLGAREELVDFRNNVIYNWQNKAVYGGENGHYNFVANYFKPGPSTKPSAAKNILDPSKTETLPYGRFYVQNNELEGFPEGLADNLKIVTSLTSVYVSHPYPAEPIPQKNAYQAYVDALEVAGASLRRDTLDARIVKDIYNGTGNIIDVQGGFTHGTPYAQTKQAWPALQPGFAPADADRDGMPDAWEIQQQLDPKNPNDNIKYTLSAVFTNLEVYLNSVLL
jgi:pectate lyase